MNTVVFLNQQTAPSGSYLQIGVHDLLNQFTAINCPVKIGLDEKVFNHYDITPLKLNEFEKHNKHQFDTILIHQFTEGYTQKCLDVARTCLNPKGKIILQYQSQQTYLWRLWWRLIADNHKQCACYSVRTNEGYTFGVIDFRQPPIGNDVPPYNDQFDNKTFMANEAKIRNEVSETETVATTDIKIESKAPYRLEIAIIHEGNDAETQACCEQFKGSKANISVFLFGDSDFKMRGIKPLKYVDATFITKRVTAMAHFKDMDFDALMLCKADVRFTDNAVAGIIETLQAFQNYHVFDCLHNSDHAFSKAIKPTQSASVVRIPFAEPYAPIFTRRALEEIGTYSNDFDLGWGADIDYWIRCERAALNTGMIQNESFNYTHRIVSKADEALAVRQMQIGLNSLYPKKDWNLHAKKYTGINLSWV